MRMNVMGRILTGVAAIVSAQVLLSTSPALADFRISKPKPKAAVQVSPDPGHRARPVRRPRAPVETAATQELAGIDPALMKEAVVAANYGAKLVWNPEDRTAVVQATDNKSGWSVNFSDCSGETRCQSMEFYTRWQVSNEANVCTIWSRDITKDPGRSLGKPFCYTVPRLDRQLHLKLSSDQAPYAGIERLSREQAKQRMETMIRVWSTYLPMLPQAWTVAQQKCPRVGDRCT
jgi:hypothetical protein